MENNFSPTKKIVMAVIAVITWFALALQFYLSLKTVSTTGFSTIKTVINFFSYFTILSNLLVAITLTVSLINPRTFFSKIPLQSAIAVYIFMVGLVYNLVLRNVWEPKGWQLVADNLLHVAVPFLYVLFWGIFTPNKKLRWAYILPWLIFPAMYLVYSLVRGSVINWYPYPFIHAGELGYGKITINSLFVLVAFIIVGLGMIAVNRRGKEDVH